MGKKKVIAYIDGYNLYANCQAALRKPKDDPYTKCYEELLRIMWYDPREIVHYCGEFDDLKPSDIETHFYTSRPRSGGNYHPGHYDRYTKALDGIGVEVIAGKFKTDERNLDSDSINNIITKLEDTFKLNPYQKKTLKEFKYFLETLEISYQKEKQTDVHLAIDMAGETDAHTVVLVSMDCDFDPVIRKIIEKKSDMNILILLPPVPKNEIEDRETRKNRIYEEATAAAEDIGISLNEENFKIKNIKIEDIKECPLLEVKRGRKESDFKNKLKYYCQCRKNECKERGIPNNPVIQP